MLAEQELRILVVEDDRIDREIYRRCLRQNTVPRFNLTESDSAASGIELVKTSRPDCILLDYNLPDMNGLEVLDRIKVEGGSMPCAVVMLTAFGGEGLAVQAMKAGVMDYLPKRQVGADTLPYTIANAIQKFRMQRRIAEQRAALERSERRYRMLLEAIPQMVWTVNAEGCLEYANRRWLEYTGLSSESGGSLGWDEVLHPEDREPTLQAWKSATASGSVFEIEHRLRRASDQSYRWYLVRAVPLRNGNGEASWFGTCTEVENQKQAAKATLQREKLEGLGMMAGGIAHDFNNLLMCILGGASLAMDALPASDASREILVDVIRAGERAADLTRKMLAYAGRGNFVVEPIEPGQLARETCRFLHSSLPPGIQLLFQDGTQLPAVETDTVQLRQVIVELVMNAIEAIGEDNSGTIWVRCKLADLDADLGAVDLVERKKLETAVAAGVKFVALEVEDTGCGMDQSLQAKIFDPFFSTKFTGRGMGLSAVQGFVRSNGGAIRVRSRPGAGSVFQVLLPGVAKSHHSASYGAP